MRTNYVKEQIDDMQNNSIFRLYRDRLNGYHIINECSKLAQKKTKQNKTRHDWVDKVIRWESCKKMKFDHTTKW